MEEYKVTGIRVWVKAEDEKDAERKVANFLSNARKRGEITDYDGKRWDGKLDIEEEEEI